MANDKKSVLDALDAGMPALKEWLFKGIIPHLVYLFCAACFVWPICNLDIYKKFSQNKLPWDDRVDIAITTAVIFGVLLVGSACFLALRKRRANIPVLDSLIVLNDWLGWTLALPLILVAGVPGIEQKHALTSLFSIAGATGICAVWLYRILGRYQWWFRVSIGAGDVRNPASQPARPEKKLADTPSDREAPNGLKANEDSINTAHSVALVESVNEVIIPEIQTLQTPGGLLAPSPDSSIVHQTENVEDDEPEDEHEPPLDKPGELSQGGDGTLGWDESVQSISINAAPSNVDALIPPPEVEKASQSNSWSVAAAWLSLCAMAAAFAYHFSRLAFNNHHSFRSQMADLGYYDNIFYQRIHGIPLGCTFLLGEVHYSSHFDPLLVLLSPLYLFYPQAEGILVIQSVWLALGVIPMYLITQHALGKRWLSVLMGGLLLAYAPLHGPALYDFHSLTLLGPLALWLMYTIQRRAWRWFYVVLVLCLLTREDISFVMFLVGASIVLSLDGTDRKHGLFTIAAALTYFVFVKTSVMISSDLLNCSEGGTCFGSMFKDLAPAKKGSGEILLSLWTSPSYALSHMFDERKFVYFVQLFLPLCFLPFFAPRGRLIMLFGIAVIALGTKFALFSIGFQYSTWIYPFAFAITPLALKHLHDGAHPWLALDRRRIVPTLVFAMVIGSVLLTWRYGAIVKNDAFRGGFGRVTYDIKDGHIKTLAWLQKAKEKIPKTARLGVSRHMAPHVSNRPFVYPFPSWGRKGKPGPEYLLVRMRDLRKRSKDLKKDIKDGYYKIIAKKSDIYVLKVTDWTKVKPKPSKKRKEKRAKSKKRHLKRAPILLGSKVGTKPSSDSSKASAKKRAKAQTKKRSAKKKKRKASSKKRSKKKRRSKKRRRGPRVR